MHALRPLLALSLLVAACRAPASSETAPREPEPSAPPRDTAAGEASAPAVRIDAAVPRRAARGTKLTLHGSGFSREANDVRFEGVGACGGYVWDVASPDGRTLELTVPDTLAEFPKTRPQPGCGYVYIAYVLRAGLTSISVLNRDGTSNAVALEVI